jgi:hypothetical protein
VSSVSLPLLLGCFPGQPAVWLEVHPYGDGLIAIITVSVPPRRSRDQQLQKWLH